MTKKKEKGALALARALKRYSDMQDPAAAFFALHDEWPPAIANIPDGVMWAEAPLRSEKKIVRDLRTLNRRAYEQSKAVAAFMKKGLSAQRAVDSIIAAANTRMS